MASTRSSAPRTCGARSTARMPTSGCAPSAGRGGALAARRGRIHSATRDERDIRRRVDREAADHADAGNQHAGERGPQDARQVVLRRVQREAGADLIVRDDRRHDRLVRRHRQRVGHADHGRQRDHHPRRGPARHEQHDEQDRAQHLDRLEQRDHAPAVVAIGEEATRERQQPRRRAHRERVEPDQERRRAEAQQQPRLARPAAPRTRRSRAGWRTRTCRTGACPGAPATAGADSSFTPQDTPRAAADRRARRPRRVNAPHRETRADPGRPESGTA